MATFSTVNTSITKFNISIKLHYLHSHLDYIPENLGDLSEEEGDRFHQDIRTMEERYLGYWNRSRYDDGAGGRFPGSAPPLVNATLRFNWTALLAAKAITLLRITAH
ncbi:hypothetical protein EVAR_33561_1 [Eumeta japonica]|uniref:Uncharacterized protein n=1 Tax=Eumeta variegata TaxID=151549 RepID=A0A4C1VJQ0_EUMVA|nr:hypothetical protein EVAR_33561_1 [Eumeta japonica]